MNNAFPRYPLQVPSVAITRALRALPSTITPLLGVMV